MLDGEERKGSAAEEIGDAAAAAVAWGKAGEGNGKQERCRNALLAALID